MVNGEKTRFELVDDSDKRTEGHPFPLGYVQKSPSMTSNAAS